MKKFISLVLITTLLFSASCREAEQISDFTEDQDLRLSKKLIKDSTVVISTTQVTNTNDVTKDPPVRDGHDW